MNPTIHITEKLSLLNAVRLKTLEIGPETLENHILSSLLSKKYRKFSVNEQYLNHVKSSVNRSVKYNEPIKIILIFGGYKLWRLKGAPECDWAELFALMHYSSWLKSVCQVYPPGVELELFSDDIAIEMLNAIPAKEQEKYIASVERLIGFLTKKIPDNLSIRLNRAGNYFKSYSDFCQLLTEKAHEIKSSEKQALVPDSFKKSFMLNSSPDIGNSPLSSLLNEKYYLYRAYTSISGQLWDGHKIRISPLTSKTTLALGTTKNSIVKFWVGSGVLLSKNGELQNTIMSPTQLEKYTLEANAIDIAGLDMPNFKSILVATIPA